MNEIAPNSQQAENDLVDGQSQDEERDLPRRTLMRLMMQMQYSYSGPVPPPAMLRQYDEIDPGRAAKLLQLAEDQSRHRMKLEEKVISSDIARSWRGLNYGLIISCLCIVAGATVAIVKSPTAGATIATATVVALAGVFVYGSIRQSKERRERRKMLESNQPVLPAEETANED